MVPSRLFVFLPWSRFPAHTWLLASYIGSWVNRPLDFRGVLRSEFFMEARRRLEKKPEAIKKNFFLKSAQKSWANRGSPKVLLEQVSTEQIRIISLTCHLFGCKKEGGILILCLLNSPPTIILTSSGQDTSLGGTRAGFWWILPGFSPLQNLRSSRYIKLCPADRQGEDARCRSGGAPWLPSRG